ncbi:MAG: chromosomal replication initiator protein DnaA [Acidobacteria bacterium]|nr:chromosomal replication initiator protein DnaA [Acidobacteriota bacterium]
MSEVNVWDSVLSSIEKRINHESFTTWFKPIIFMGKAGVTIRLGVPDSVFEDWILNNYRDVMDESLEEANLSGHSINFELVNDATRFDEGKNSGLKIPSRRDSFSKSETVSAPASPAPVVQSPMTIAHFSDTEVLDLPLNQKYIFQTFVVGSCNQFAHAAALAVADSPSKTYNPLYIYGGVGLGKTHLMCAIGHRVKEQNRHLRLMYISAEKFMNELINAIRYDQTMVFRDKYRSIDVLLIDDIQFIAGKERTQEEFFHTFNALYDGQKQIVISSDCPPREIPTLEERLHSRFEWGLIADIQPPDLETKIAILRKKAETEKIDLPDNVALFIASKIKSNIRELEGSLVRLTALSSLKGESINLLLAQEALKNIVEEEERAITIETIQKVVADFYNLKVADLKSKTNSRNIAVPRQIAMYLCKTLTKASLPEIGREFGGKHHTTVLHSINKINDLYDQRGHFHRIINSLIDSCK